MLRKKRILNRAEKKHAAEKWSNWMGLSVRECTVVAADQPVTGLSWIIISGL